MDNLTNISLEQGILSTVIWDPAINFQIATDGLSPDCFTSAAYRRLFLTLQHMTEKGISIHEPTLVVDAYNREPAIDDNGRQCKEGSDNIDVVQYFDMIQSSPHRLDIAENVSQYVRVLIDLANRRRAFKLFQSSAEMIRDMSIDAGDTTAMATKMLTEACSADINGVVSFSDAQEQLTQSIADNIAGRSPASFPTGFKALDVCGGLHPGNLVVIAAQSSHGKTALAMSMVAGGRGPRVAYYSLEMTPRELMARFMARHCKVPSNTLMYGCLNAEQQTAYNKALEATKVNADRMFFYEMRGSSVEGISQSIRYLHAKNGIDIAIIDYLQILGLKTARGQTRESVIAAAARDFKNLAKQLGIVIILLSQMNRDTTLGRVPSVNRIRDSGEINESADVTLVLWRPEQEDDSARLSYPKKWEDVDIHNTALISVAKDRNGGTGGPHEFIVGFNPQLTYFYELDQLPPKQPSPQSTGNPW